MEALKAQPAGPPLETLHHSDAGGVSGNIKNDFGRRARSFLSLAQYVLPQRMTEPVEVLPGYILLGFGDQVIPPGRDMRSWAVVQGEREIRIIKNSMGFQGVAGDRPKQTANPVQSFLGSSQVDLQPLVHVFVKMLQQHLAGVTHSGLNLLIEFESQFFKSGLNFLFAPASLIDLQDTALKIHPGFDGAQNIVAGTENACEQVEFQFEQFLDTTVGLVALVEEIDNHHVVFLAITVATAYPLFDALRIPGQIKVDDGRAELKVQTLGTGLCRDQDTCLVTETINDCRSEVHLTRAGSAT